MEIIVLVLRESLPFCMHDTKLKYCISLHCLHVSITKDADDVANG